MAQSMTQQSQGTEYSTSYTWGQSFDMDNAIGGGASEDYVHDQGVKYSFRINMRDTGENGYILPEDMIDISTKETMTGLKTLIAEVTKIWFPIKKQIKHTLIEPRKSGPFLQKKLIGSYRGSFQRKYLAMTNLIYHFILLSSGL